MKQNKQSTRTAVLTYKVVSAICNHSPVMCRVNAHSNLPLPTILLIRLSSYQTSAVEPFQLPSSAGKHCLTMSSQHHPLSCSGINWKKTFLFQRSFCC